MTTDIRSSAQPLVSVVVPCFNEEDVIGETYRRLTAVLCGSGQARFELIFVNDGSRDRTLELLRGIQAGDPSVRVVSFSRNFGHQMAVTAGIDHAEGEAVVLIDADLQDPPEVVLEMLARWRRGVDVVYGVRGEREGETAIKLWTAKVFYRLINAMSDTPIPLDTGDFRLMDRSVVEALHAMPERDRFVRGMVSWVGFHQEPVVYRRAGRFAGTTKYPLDEDDPLRGRRHPVVLAGAAAPGDVDGVRGGRVVAPRHPLRYGAPAADRHLGAWLDAAVHRAAVRERRPARVPGRHRRVRRPDLRREQAPAALPRAGAVGLPARGTRGASGRWSRSHEPRPAPLAAADRRPGDHRRVRAAAEAPAAGRRRAGGDGTDVRGVAGGRRWRRWPAAMPCASSAGG